MNRRDFLRGGFAAAVGVAAGSSLWGRAAGALVQLGMAGPYGPLLPPDANGLALPVGFRSRVIARGDRRVAGTRHVWHREADGAAVFPVEGGYVYVSNSEVDGGGGGAGAIRFDARGAIRDAYSICTGTARNCAGGPTPWGSWLSCEETGDGLVWECDPVGRRPQVPRRALGRFKHEAVAVDPFERRLYLTEDEDDGLFYRFTPDVWGDLSSGVLEAARVRDHRVTWAIVPEPDPRAEPTRRQVEGAATFDGGEGIVYSRGHVYFVTKGDDRVWNYHPGSGKLSVCYDARHDPHAQLTGVDNITASRAGELLVAEDGGNMEVVLLTPDCVASALVRVVGQRGSELAGPAFDPTGRRLYFSSQRGGPGGAGITYEVTGPFRR